MKRLAVLSLLLLLTLVISTGQGHAAIVNVSVDENGHGLTDFGSPGSLHPLTSGIIADPSGGVAGGVLAYLLPFTPVQGDVVIDESVGTAVVLSDVVRFFNNFMLFYSDTADGPADLADVGLPTNASTNVVSFLEVGPEGNNGLFYIPAPGNPGFISTDFSGQYNLISDAVPEPGSLLLLAAGLSGFALIKRYRLN